MTSAPRVRRMREALALLLAALALAGCVADAPVQTAAAPAPPAPAGDPSPDDHWMADVNSPHDAPTNMTVLVVPPTFGPDRDGALQAELEALAYWDWAIRAAEAEHPQLRFVSYRVKVLGADATPEDARDARIVVTLDGATIPVAGNGWLGPGVPVGPATDPHGRRAQRCVVTNNGLEGSEGAEARTLLRNFVLHEFGHCLASGHTGESAGLAHCNAAGACYESHPTDVLSRVFGDRRQCLSNLNLQALAVAYGWMTAPGAAWELPPDETYMAKADYRETCMPDALRRY